MEQFTRRNHYLPQLYLKSWSEDDKTVCQYQLLVSNENVPVWKKTSIKEVAYHSDLYSGLLNGKETDEIEKFFQKEIEDPAKGAIVKVINHERLAKSDLLSITRFLAAQYVRTPARYFRHKPIYDRIVPSLLDKSLKKIVTETEYAIANNLPKPNYGEGGKWLPYRSEILPSEKRDKSILKVEVLCDRQIWFIEIEKILNQTYKCLLDNKWVFAEAATGVSFYTSDDPVISAFFTNEDIKIGDGGWEVSGTKIIFPISPKIVMFTEVGKDFDENIVQKSPLFSFYMQKCTIAHAFRAIYSNTPSPYITTCRSRKIDNCQFNREKNELRNWHKKQSDAEATYRNNIK